MEWRARLCGGQKCPPSFAGKATGCRCYELRSKASQDTFSCLFVAKKNLPFAKIRVYPCLSVIKKSCLAFAARYDLRVTQPACLVIFFEVVFEDLHLNQNNRLESRRRCLHILQKMRYIPILLAFLFAVTSNARAQVYADVSVSHGAQPVQAGNV
jgi:hypothetical protein